MNKGNLQAELLAELEEEKRLAAIEAAERCEEKDTDVDYDVLNEYDAHMSNYDSESDYDYDDYDRYDDGEFDAGEWEELDRQIHAPLCESEAERYARLWAECGY